MCQGRIGERGGRRSERCNIVLLRQLGLASCEHPSHHRDLWTASLIDGLSLDH